MLTLKEKELQKTYNYEQFTPHRHNRKVYPEHVNNLTQSMIKHGYEEGMPLIVNYDNTIIDGHHRLLAAKQAKVPVYFVTKNIHNEKELDELVISLNTTSKNWTIEDYVDFWCKLELKQYELLSAMSKEYKVPLAMTAALLNEIPNNKHCTNSIKTGTFEIKADISKTEQLIQRIKILDTIFKTGLSKKAAEAFTFVIQKGLDTSEFHKKANKNMDKIYSGSTTEILRCIDDICGLNTKQKTNYRISYEFENN